jgi:hypothetical protein
VQVLPPPNERKLEQRLPPALLFNESVFLSAGLYTWPAAGADGHLTTSTLVPQVAGAPALGRAGRAPLFGTPPASEQGEFQGLVFNPDLPASAVPTEVQAQALASYDCGGAGYVTTTVNPGPGCTLVAKEGYVYPAGTAGKRELRRWTKNGQSLTTTRSAPGLIAGGWTKVLDEGAVLNGAVDAITLHWAPRTFYHVELTVKTKTTDWTHCLWSTAYTGMTLLPTSCASKIRLSDITGIKVEQVPDYLHKSLPPYQVSRDYDGVSDEVDFVH